MKEVIGLILLILALGFVFDPYGLGESARKVVDGFTGVEATE